MQHVLVLLVGSQETRRVAGGDDLAVLGGEGLRGAVDVVPAGEVLAVEERHEAVLVRLRSERGQGEEEEGAEGSHGSISGSGGKG